MHDLTAGHGRNDTRNMAPLNGALHHLINPGKRSVVPIGDAHARQATTGPSSAQTEAAQAGGPAGGPARSPGRSTARVARPGIWFDGALFRPAGQLAAARLRKGGWLR